MSPKSDAQLLREYAEHGAETAFAGIVTRHTNLVYSAALRQVDSPDIAAEVAQSVFIGLARGRCRRSWTGMLRWRGGFAAARATSRSTSGVMNTAGIPAK